jgi:hypothetical protein
VMMSVEESELARERVRKSVTYGIAIRDTRYHSGQRGTERGRERCRERASERGSNLLGTGSPKRGVKGRRTGEG